MRKPVVAIIVLVLVVAFYFALKRPASQEGPQVGASTSEPGVTAQKATNTATTRPKWSKPNRPGETQDAPPASTAIVYGPSEFSRGELQNVVIDGGIRLGDNASFVPRFNPKYRLFGNYISPEEEIQAPFDSASINFQVTSLNNNEANFEIRTRDKDGVWSEWREVSPQAMKEPISFQNQAVAWQFRVSLFANDSASSPKVEAISIEPMSLR